MAKKPPTWVQCDMCEEFVCTIHGGHAADCTCPTIEVWCEGGYSPYDDPVTPALEKFVKENPFQDED